MHKELEKYLGNLLPLLKMNGIDISDQREIAYGVQFRLFKYLERATMNLYFSEKRGISKVVSAAQGSMLKRELELLVMDEAPQPISLHNWNRWIGSDECGKGDYFGPLIVSSFYLEQEQAPALLKLGVCDSKALRNDRVIAIAKNIYAQYPSQFSCLILKPLKYNDLISSFNKKNQNLNDLLAWAHETTITELIAKRTSAEGVLVDQFTKNQKVKARLHARKVRQEVLERTGAERDVAVAAASILARYQFLMARESMNRFYKMTLPLGASKEVDKAAKAFVSQYGIGRLGEVAKLHFKNTERLRITP